jgi:prepilin-type N-terminal cleavage/methylation domain-containing protein
MRDMQNIPSQNRPQRRQSGFSLIEVMIATVVLVVGLVGLLGLFGLAVKTTQTSQENLIAKQVANNAMESILASRNAAQVSWLQIQNVGAGTTPDGIFLTGFQDATNGIHGPGADKIYGTADDASDPIEYYKIAGRDGFVGTGDDQTILLSRYFRKIEIAPVAGTNSVRQVTITVMYQASPQYQLYKYYVLQTYISQFSD